MLLCGVVWCLVDGFLLPVYVCWGGLAAVIMRGESSPVDFPGYLRLLSVSALEEFVFSVRVDVSCVSSGVCPRTFSSRGVAHSSIGPGISGHQDAVSPTLQLNLLTNLTCRDISSAAERLPLYSFDYKINTENTIITRLLEVPMNPIN